MEVEVFGGLEEIFKGKEKESFNSFLHVHKIDALQNIVPPQTNNAKKNVVTSNLTSDLDEDLDKVVQDFKKKITNDLDDDDDLDLDEDLTIQELLQMEPSVVLDVEDDEEDVDGKEEEQEVVQEVHHQDSFPVNNKPVGIDNVPFERYEQPMNHGGLLSLGGSNYSRYHNYYNQYNNYNARNMNYGVSSRLTDAPNSWNASRNMNNYGGYDLLSTRPGSWDTSRNNNYGVSGRATEYPSLLSYPTPGGVVGTSPIMPSLSSLSLSSSSSSYEGDCNRLQMLLCGHIDISFLKPQTTRSSNQIVHEGYSSTPSWNNLHGVPLGHSYSSIPPPHTPWWNNLPRGDSFYGGGSGCGGGYLSTQYGQLGNNYGVGLLAHSQRKSGEESVMNTLKKVSNNYTKVVPKIRKERKPKLELPPGWEVIIRPRKNGKSKGQVDKYYIHRETKVKFRSLQAVHRYIESQAALGKNVQV